MAEVIPHPENPPASASPRQLAALDLGSNSFHLIVAQETGGRIQVVDKIREMVRLADALDGDDDLAESVAQRAIDCLQRFGQRLRHLQHDNVRVVGTQTLRYAKNADTFIAQAEEALGHPVEIISGREEARLIYLGVSHSLQDENERRLVIDIGGGSTELILGRRFQPELMESLAVGCVGLSRRFFKDGITKRKFQNAVTQVKQELEPVQHQYQSAGWDTVIGASGTILSVQDVLQEPNGFTSKGVKSLVSKVIVAGAIDKIELPGLSNERRPVFAGGLAVLGAIIDTLGIKHIQTSQGALREGLLQDLLGRVQHHDIRETTVADLTSRYHVDRAHASRVRDTALSLLAQVAVPWHLQGSADRLQLGWAADLHEIGMDIAHNQYHKHGGYLIANMEMPGFSRSDQVQLASIVRAHRRKLPVNEPGFDALNDKRIARLTALLRIAVVLHRSRTPDPLPHVSISAKNAELRLTIPKKWLAKHPLTQLDLDQEAELSSAIQLTVNARSKARTDKG
jgi:exopolyphosphatase/guanosine-5'-triphosphate,3'-diphosphate pyrophosphatase